MKTRICHCLPFKLSQMSAFTSELGCLPTVRLTLSSPLSTGVLRHITPCHSPALMFLYRVHDGNQDGAPAVMPACGPIPLQPHLPPFLHTSQFWSQGTCVVVFRSSSHLGAFTSAVTGAGRPAFPLILFHQEAFPDAAGLLWTSFFLFLLHPSFQCHSTKHTTSPSLTYLFFSFTGL